MAQLVAIGFDADDTLWHSENHFALVETRFQALLGHWLDEAESAKQLLERERANLELYGYGIKGFTLSMVEAAIEASEGMVTPSNISEIIGWGKEMLAHPVELLPGVVEVIEELAGTHRLVLITKGDLFHQESKIAESGLADRFEHLEVLSEKSPQRYRTVLDQLGIDPAQFLMVGNSVRSDIAPLLEIGANAVHIPYRFTWAHELLEERPPPDTWHQLSAITELPEFLKRFSG